LLREDILVQTLQATNEMLLQFIRDARDCLVCGDSETALSLLVNAVDFHAKGTL
jgi:hypothetical protein